MVQRVRASWRVPMAAWWTRAGRCGPAEEPQWCSFPETNDHPTQPAQHHGGDGEPGDESAQSAVGRAAAAPGAIQQRAAQPPAPYRHRLQQLAVVVARHLSVPPCVNVDPSSRSVPPAHPYRAAPRQPPVLPGGVLGLLRWARSSESSRTGTPTACSRSAASSTSARLSESSELMRCTGLAPVTVSFMLAARTVARRTPAMSRARAPRARVSRRADDRTRHVRTTSMATPRLPSCTHRPTACSYLGRQANAPARRRPRRQEPPPGHAGQLHMRQVQTAQVGAAQVQPRPVNGDVIFRGCRPTPSAPPRRRG